MDLRWNLPWDMIRLFTHLYVCNRLTVVTVIEAVVAGGIKPLKSFHIPTGSRNCAL